MFAESGIGNAVFNDGTMPIDEKSKMRPLTKHGQTA
jgi:hypothetical protein